MFNDVDLMTAIITPFAQNGEVDYKALKKLTEHLLATGSQGFVIGGTTGETPTLTEKEKLDLYQEFVKIVDHRVPIVAGAGSNNTEQTIDFINKLSKIDGIDMALVVVPYYNKPNQRGMIAHFETVAKNSPLPIMIYNIPGRTGVLMEKETVVKLAQNSNISGVKQCNTLEDLEYIVEHTDKDFAVYSGEDAQALFAKVIGANGVVSVASHIYGNEMTEMYKDLDEGNYQIAGKIQRQLTPKMSALFMYPSPSPVKAALNQLGYEVGGCRLPIVSLNDEEKNILFKKLDL
ncbi:4-hydroxy-tetrahydrodipicolinate synthase [Companilactobacillus halodurans]|uniref:4-hydroxy-tetrahydrodipicolinate synthase n=1 Tax=Companilactobacillus halodurans TaxID=2584183 RepID=A0A5P0ZN60_9LACO|nr:4-hydroxy-tetrahydrodipicolinate synthase [Companilactobacillus halodurans]MQS75612.1 4-hydroxy-tetrahydrodipicolinate synthase [Companilactobacillus halodurans]MQS96325.1 4-hydroxy-tetrahydrodipicolinate synthase [Companilactobacillus halodurans]